IYENAPVLIDAFDINGRCVLWNNECQKTFGWTIDEINAHDDALSLLNPDPATREEVNRTVTTDPDAHFREWHPVTKSGRTLDTMWTNFLLPDGLTLNLGYDITEQKLAEKRVKASLKEKEILIHEIHHRVKNNMNVISSLLKLQANSIEDEQTKNILKESQNRVYTMSAIHETLHGSENLSEIDLKRYLSKITNSIFQSSSVNPRKVKLNNDIEEIPISINQASPLGLVINELISNSLKYAFPEDREGEINVSMKKLDKGFELIVKDDGIGMPENLDWKNSNTLGLKLVRTLVENQLDGSIDMESHNGTRFIIKLLTKCELIF
ncbi:MAG: PAS domain S-box protein, partial [Proteobacteria bacterium]|nr:PAS domain S-box protein [Pseudomonadota bacterium]